MSPIEAVIEGTLKPDGTLELDRKPDLPAGRVTVRVQPAAQVVPPAAAPGVPYSRENDPFFQMLEEIWAEREAAGLVPRSVEEVEEERRQLRDEWEDRVTRAGELQEESQRLRRQQNDTSAENGK